MRKWLVLGVVVVLAALIVVVTVGRSSAAPAHLMWPASASFTVNPPVSATTTWTFGGMAMCTDVPGRVKVTGAATQGGDGQMRVIAVGTESGRSTLAASQRSLAAEGFTVGGAVDITCRAATRSSPDWLGVTVAGPGSFTSLRLDYLSGGHREHLVIPWSSRICPPGPFGFCQ